MLSTLTPPLNGYSKSVQLWYVTNFLSGIAWAGILFIPKPGIESTAERLIQSLLITFCGAVFSVITIPIACLSFAFALNQPQARRFIFCILLIGILWILSNFLVSLLFGGSLAEAQDSMSMTWPNLPAAYLAAAYVYRPWLFRPDTPAS